MAEESELTPRQRAFVDAWFGEARFNATEAARLAGYGNGSGNPNVWNNAGSRLLANAKVRAEVQRRWAAHGVTSEEVLSRLTSQMRGSIADLLDPDSLGLDPDKVQANGHLIKSLRHTRSGLVVELYSAQEAAIRIGQTLGMFNNKVELSGSVELDLGSLTIEQLQRIARGEDPGSVVKDAPVEIPNCGPGGD